MTEQRGSVAAAKTLISAFSVPLKPQHGDTANTGSNRVPQCSRQLSAILAPRLRATPKALPEAQIQRLPHRFAATTQKQQALLAGEALPLHPSTPSPMLALPALQILSGWEAR